MPKENLQYRPERLNLIQIQRSLSNVENEWQSIEKKLIDLKIGKKDTPFNTVVKDRMMSAYNYLDSLLERKLEPFTPDSISELFKLNLKVHYGDDDRLMMEYNSAINANSEKFYKYIDPISNWYLKHKKRGDDPRKIAAEIYVSILGQPQLFIEGNHRTGSLISSWVNMHHGYPPFVLSVDNAIPYFAPSAEIKKFADKTTWRGISRLPKYRKSFYKFWTDYTKDTSLMI